KKDFDIFYEDNDLFATVKSDWNSEKSKVDLIGSSNELRARIKPDFKALTYDVQVDRFTYTFKTYHIFRYYFLEGMKWEMFSSISTGHANCVNQDDHRKDVLVALVKDFRGLGPCYEVRVKDISKLRAAVAFIVCIMIKEDYKGLSVGLPAKRNTWGKFKYWLFDKGYTYEESLQVPEELIRQTIKAKMNMPTMKEAERLHKQHKKIDFW
ncbi:MAG: hypothetical protein MJ189_04105, partial [Coriobacteriales bacterium]|nr:hypothetical protein [Coriobacteriales bacterium]